MRIFTTGPTGQPVNEHVQVDLWIYVLFTAAIARSLFLKYRGGCHCLIYILFQFFKSYSAIFEVGGKDGFVSSLKRNFTSGRLFNSSLISNCFVFLITGEVYSFNWLHNESEYRPIHSNLHSCWQVSINSNIYLFCSCSSRLRKFVSLTNWSCQ